MGDHHGSFQANLNADDSREFAALKRAVTKARGNRDLAIRYVCRLYVVPRFDRLPEPVKTATLGLLDFRAAAK